MTVRDTHAVLSTLVADRGHGRCAFWAKQVDLGGVSGEVREVRQHLSQRVFPLGSPFDLDDAAVYVINDVDSPRFAGDLRTASEIRAEHLLDVSFLVSTSRFAGLLGQRRQRKLDGLGVRRNCVVLDFAYPKNIRTMATFHPGSHPSIWDDDVRCEWDVPKLVYLFISRTMGTLHLNSRHPDVGDLSAL